MRREADLRGKRHRVSEAEDFGGGGRGGLLTMSELGSGQLGLLAGRIGVGRYAQAGMGPDRCPGLTDENIPGGLFVVHRCFGVICCNLVSFTAPGTFQVY